MPEAWLIIECAFGDLGLIDVKGTSGCEGIFYRSCEEDADFTVGGLEKREIFPAAKEMLIYAMSCYLSRPFQQSPASVN